MKPACRAYRRHEGKLYKPIAWAGVVITFIEVPPPDTSENQKSGNSRGNPLRAEVVLRILFGRMAESGLWRRS